MDKEIEKLASEMQWYKDMESDYAFAEYLYLLGYRIPDQTKREAVPKLTNNIGCMSKGEIEAFATMVLKECGYSYTMKWTTAGDIMIEPFIYIDERHIGEYPYMVKERILHEVAHIDTYPQDDRHGEIFHARLAELINRFMAFGKPLFSPPDLPVIGDEEIRRVMKDAMDAGQEYGNDGKPLPEKCVATAQRDADLKAIR